MRTPVILALACFPFWASQAHHRSERRDEAGVQRERGQAACGNCERNRNGKIKRSPAARRAFRQSHPCPSTGLVEGPCDGYVIDHVVALKRGGADIPGNMQWQTVLEAKQKDRVE